MPSDRQTRRLHDIRHAIRHAQGFLEGLSYEQFSADTMRVYAVTRCLEIVSEASRHLDSEVKSRYPQLPWPQIAGSGNVYRHDYPQVREDILWNTVKLALPSLLEAIENELSAGR